MIRLRGTSIEIRPTSNRDSCYLTVCGGEPLLVSDPINIIKEDIEKLAIQLRLINPKRVKWDRLQ